MSPPGTGTESTELEEANPLAEECSLYHDILGAALSEVNWDEIAEGWLDEVAEEEEEEDLGDLTDEEAAEEDD